MKEVKDPEIKLFGKKIALLENGRRIPVASSIDYALDSAVVDVHNHNHGESISFDYDRNSDDHLKDKKGSRVGEEEEEKEGQQVKEDADKNNTHGDSSDTKSPPTVAVEPINLKSQSEQDGNPKTPPIEEGTASVAKNDNDQRETNATNMEQKPLKNPDKILPCPRCNSMDTKFCYYNNYNVNQPRHFCKSCQRYWTAGGTMRNVPVGAGRHKNKSSALQCHHITISEALQAVLNDDPNGFDHPALKCNGMVLSFGLDRLLCESTASVLNIAENKAPNGIQNGLYKLDQVVPLTKGAENGDDLSNGSSVTSSNSVGKGGEKCVQEPTLQNSNRYPSQIACLTGVPCPCPWNSMIPRPAICPSEFHMPFFSAPFWNCGVPSPWGFPWLSPLSPLANQKAPGSCPISLTLGKHSRDGELLKPGNLQGKEVVGNKISEGSVLVPKTFED